MNKSIIIGVVALIVIVGSGFALFHKSSKTNLSNTSTPATNTATPKTTAKTPATATPATPATPGSTTGPMNVTITANDTSASPDTITAAAGQQVNITFAVSKQGTYHGGLDFKSTDPAIDSGSIDEGSSKTTSFTATKSFKFTPYWYKSNVQKDYFVTINVN